jgi:hypothetical protein
MSIGFEQFARTVLACGCSARMARDSLLLTVRFLFPEQEAEEFCRQIPGEGALLLSRCVPLLRHVLRLLLPMA